MSVREADRTGKAATTSNEAGRWTVMHRRTCPRSSGGQGRQPGSYCTDKQATTASQPASQPASPPAVRSPDRHPITAATPPPVQPSIRSVLVPLPPSLTSLLGPPHCWRRGRSFSLANARRAHACSASPALPLPSIQSSTTAAGWRAVAVPLPRTVALQLRSSCAVLASGPGGA